MAAESAPPNKSSAQIMTIKIEILINEPDWKKENRLISTKIKSLIKKIVPQTELKKYLDKGLEIEISMVLSNDAEIKKLNKNYRHKNKPTNVLSFPAVNFNNLNKSVFKLGFITLGDIVLSYQTIKNESVLQKKKFDDHLSHLIIHSLLHLLGYDHEQEKEAQIMENLEINLLKKLDIANPYNVE